jgi:outer membrane protein TolC
MYYGGQTMIAAALLTLAEAVRYAAEHSPQLDTARRSAAIASSQYTSSWARFLPSLDLKSSTGINRQKQYGLYTSDNPWTSDLNVALTETLYDNGATITQFRIADLTNDSAALAFLTARDKLALDVMTAFYQLSLNIILADTRQEQLKTLVHQFTAVAAQYRQGMKTRQDYLRFKTQVGRAQIEALNAENAITTAREELRRLIGAPLPSSAGNAAAPDFNPVRPEHLDVARAVPQAAPSFEKNYQYRAAQLQYRINDLNETFAHRKYWPQVAVSAGGVYDNSGFVGSGQPFNTNNLVGWNAQLTLTYNIWDWGIRRRDVEIAEQNRGISDDAQGTALLQLNAGIRELMVELGRLRDNYKLTEEVLQLSEESYAFLNEQYRLGKIAYLDLITALGDLLDARVAFHTAYFDILRNVAQYRYYEGTLYDSIVEEKR